MPPPCLAQTQDWGGADPDCRNVSPACGFGTPALPINFEGKDIVRAAFLAAAVHAGREDIFERDVSGLLRGEQLFPMTVSVHAHSLCRIRYLTKQGRDAHRGRCPYCSSHSARDHWSARPRIVRCRPRPPKTTQTRHRRIARKGCRSCRSEEQVALPKAILPGRSGRPARPKRSLRPPPRNRPRSTMLAVSCARPSSSTKTECRRSDSRRYLPCRFLLRLGAPALADAASTATCLPPFYVSLAVARVVRSTAAASITDIRPQETALPAHHPPGRHCTSRTDSPQAA